ncbi:GntR family transcriptional regulator [Streptomyces sp. NPDC052040]|uniref:GntR family transcriptional regulator n=1 Tax=unclassified Streptomyces TaxID=2593676 RepID=UPI0037D0316A
MTGRPCQRGRETARRGVQNETIARSETVVGEDDEMRVAAPFACHRDLLPQRDQGIGRKEIAEARRTIEPVVLRMSVECGDLDWEARVRAAHHRLVRTPAYVAEEGEYYSGAWSEAHRVFHRTLLEGCGNPVLLETFDRLWTASELGRRWSAHRNPDRDGAAEHRRLEEAALARDADTAAAVLTEHLTLTAAALTGDWPGPSER